MTLRRKLEQRKGERKQILATVARFTKDNRRNKIVLTRHEKAREIVREVGMKTQQQLEFHISDITSLALESVFDNPYKLELEFIQRRNKTECDIWFTRNGKRVIPKKGSGGGAIDIAAFALRIASWSMKYPRPMNTIILDEPFKFLSINHREAASQMIKQLSDKLGIQFIIITHDPILASYADKEFKVVIKNGISKIKIG